MATNKTPYEILRNEIIQWVSDCTGLVHIDEPLSVESKEGFFTIVTDKGRSNDKTSETEFYKFLFFKTSGKAIMSYTEHFSDISQIRAKVHKALSRNYESSESCVINFNYRSYEYDYDEGILSIIYSFDFDLDTSY